MPLRDSEVGGLGVFVSYVAAYLYLVAGGEGLLLGKRGARVEGLVMLWWWEGRAEVQLPGPEVRTYG